MGVVPARKYDRRVVQENYAHRETPNTPTSSQEMQLGELIGTMVDSWRLIVGFALVILLVGIIYLLLATPVYQADVLLQVEKKPNDISSLMKLDQTPTNSNKEIPLSAEYEIIRSRMVLGSAVDHLNLDIIAQPKYFPVLGKPSSESSGLNQIANPWLGLSKYAWGGERLEVETFDVPADYMGKEFTLIAGKQGSYQLFGENGAFLLKGAVGKLAVIPLTDNTSIQLFISELKARPGTYFDLVKNNRLATIAQLKDKLTINELGEQKATYGNQSGILQLSLEGTDRKKITNTLNDIANTYLRYSVDSKSNETQKTLAFLNEQLPLLKQKMDSAESALNTYRLKKGSVDLPVETQTTVEKVVSIESQLSKLKQDREELIRRFTPQHPRIMALDAQMATLNSELKNVELKIKDLPSTQQDILRLTRDADVNRTLYTTLLNSAQELRVLKAGTMGNVHIVDYAVVPIKPVRPKPEFVIAISIFLGLLSGSGSAFLRKSLYGTVKDPDVLEKKLGLRVYATIPYSRKQKELSRVENLSTFDSAILAVASPHDLAIESLRSLRTSLYFEDRTGRNKVISITSPSPGSGKSFVCVNFGVVLAGTGKRVLIIDADLRKGRVHEYFQVTYDIGLSDLISHVEASDAEFNKVIHNTSIKNLDFIPVGTIPPNPSELLLHRKFELMLDVVSDDYDYIVIDSPPILAATDAAIIGNIAGSCLLVVKDNQNSLNEIEQSVKQLVHAGVNLGGAIYNGIKMASGRYGYGRYYYAYSYSNKKTN